MNSKSTPLQMAQSALNRSVSLPLTSSKKTDQICRHSNCIIAALRGARQGLYYGGRVRFAHSIIMQLLFGKGTTYQKLQTAIKLSWQHGKNLGIFVFVYKVVQCALNQLTGRRRHIFAFFAGVISALIVWRERNSVNQQLCFYLIARVLQGLLQNARAGGYYPQASTFGYISVLFWGLVMLLFEYDKSKLQPSLSSSMTFLYHDSDAQPTNWRDFFPIYVPHFQSLQTTQQSQ